MERAETGFMGPSKRSCMCPAASMPGRALFGLSSPSRARCARNQDYRLDLGPDPPRPRNARACYSDRWAPHHFERLGPVWLLPPGETLPSLQ